MSWFWIDSDRGIKKTYSDLLEDINKKEYYRPFIYCENPYDIFLELIYGMVIGVEAELLDYDLSSNELENLGLNSQCTTNIVYYKVPALGTVAELLSEIVRQDKWRLTLYTSGTTGRPKKVAHKLTSLTRGVKIGEKFVSNVWGFAYNPTHIAGLQVFLQALFNQNAMVNLFNLNWNEINQALLLNKVTNISGTPTFYRTIAPTIKEPVPSVQRITLGGEKFDSMLPLALATVFPNANIRNVYASTETGSLFESKGDFFVIPETIKSKIKILNGELLIHQSLLGESRDVILDQDWYHTGDLVETMTDNTIKFIARNSDMINIGGYKISLNEVEEEIKKIDGVLDAIVKARKNKVTGNILTASIVKSSSITESEMERRIILHLSMTLQQWKLPRIINFVDEIDKTRTGKKVRI